MRELLRSLLRPTLEEMFPGINWNKVLGKKKPIRSNVHIVPGVTDNSDCLVADYDADEMLEAQQEYDEYVVDDVDHNWQEPGEDGYVERDVDIAEDYRDCVGGQSGLGYRTFSPDGVDIFDYIGDISSHVNIDVLQKLDLLPKFVGDIVDCIKTNLSQRIKWTEGYNKKLGYPLGNFKAPGELPNLVIIDCSWSIPDGIAATMLTLADTLREQCNAELIITSMRSGYYPIGAKLPSPQALRDYYGRSNESEEFMAILKKYIAGREFGHVISFGDNDNPGYIYQHYHDYTDGPRQIDMTGTKVHQVHHYHTSQYNVETGYARWVHEICPDVETEYDTTWCDVMNKSYKM